jgi:hypothetical protein
MQNQEGNWGFELYSGSVMTVEKLKNKGHCCKSSCLHCPYGHTVKVHKILFQPLEKKHLPLLNSMQSIPLKEVEQDLESHHLVLLKNILIGCIKVDKLFVRGCYLLPEFSEQNISKELIESYFFY